MIEAISIQGYKSLKHVDLTLNPFTIFVGPNSSGKTTTLSAIDLNTQIFNQYEKNKTNPIETIQTITNKKIENIMTLPSTNTLFMSHEKEKIKHETRINKSDHSLILSSNKKFEIKSTSINQLGINLARRGEDNNLIIPADTQKDYQQEGPLRLLQTQVSWARLQSQLLSMPSPGSTTRPTLSPAGWNLPTVLNYAHSRRDGSLEAIEADMASLIPNLKRLYLEPTNIIHKITEKNGMIFHENTNTNGFRLEIEFEHIGRVPAEHVSEGTLLALGLLTLMHTEPAEVILMDDVERGLHPAAQQQLVRLLRKIQERHHVQLILSTHSPFLLDLCEPEEVRVFGRDAQGYTVARPLTDHKDAQKWRKLMRTGEFWSVVGEDWVNQDQG
jgi:AAA15 family ATPase/GTPase